ncbi:LLM class flavin-dependent oxidoreductase [Phytohabitans sp. ZYX-F-186]|uniref:LLM class flavin-dependent oxidoreductase n=1 Tax=Phytohabitans maris TaxID=3071409 RepID=A0ABU0ZFM5_9ACTN|nr:LLM class flavin-dependent oxidoreductase [Phytohabitans sp. ZYX-F-186]MDQ7905132.1 LLM class flavin-dependent oxidoreductase [Phytohabitans sp. ZYX-F-186]
MGEHRFVVGLRLDDPTVPSTVDVAGYRRAALAAEAAGADFVLVDDGYVAAGRGVGPDPVMLAARLAAATSRIGVVAAAAVTYGEPLLISSGLATLDHLSDGRAGWLVLTAPTAAQAALHGAAPRPERELWDEAGEVVDVVGRLWDSWEDGAVIRDARTGRYLDRRRLHRVDYTGPAFSIAGPSITPRPPQGHPVVAVRADASGSRAVTAHADVLVIAVDPAAPGDAVARRAGQAVAESGRPRHQVRVLGELPAGGTVGAVERLAAAGALDGVIVPAGDDPVAALRAALGSRGAAAPPAGPTLRERLGLPRPANRYATAPPAAP